MSRKHLQRFLTIPDIGGRDMNRMWQSIRIDRQMALDPENFLPRVAAFLLRRVRVLHALCIDDAKRRLVRPYVALFRHLILFMPAPAGSILH